ncbi:MAG: hypothetical protein Q8S13_02945 [Dehalococcoidia bacterium]|nr:hypothetical protein [Dehalococcoidia bacterium]
MSTALAYPCIHCKAPLEASHNEGDNGPWLVVYAAGGNTTHVCARKPPARRYRPVVDPVSPAQQAADALRSAVAGIEGMAGRLDSFGDAVGRLERIVQQRTRQQAPREESRPVDRGNGQETVRGALAI